MTMRILTILALLLAAGCDGAGPTAPAPGGPLYEIGPVLRDTTTTTDTATWCAT